MSDLREISQSVPFDRSALPSWVYDIRAGLAGSDADGTLFACSANYEFHVHWRPSGPRDWAPVLNNLGGALFEKEFPGEFGNVVKAQAIAARDGHELPPRIKKMLARQRELSVPSDFEFNL